jgi:hypothetical protein
LARPSRGAFVFPTQLIIAGEAGTVGGTRLRTCWSARHGPLRGAAQHRAHSGVRPTAAPAGDAGDVEPPGNLPQSATVPALCPNLDNDRLLAGVLDISRNPMRVGLRSMGPQPAQTQASALQPMKATQKLASNQTSSATKSWRTRISLIQMTVHSPGTLNSVSSLTREKPLRQAYALSFSRSSKKTGRSRDPRCIDCTPKAVRGSNVFQALCAKR